MPNRLINPLIHPDVIDTLSHCADCMVYITESLDSAVYEEGAKPALHGLSTLLACITQAIEFETDRAEYGGKTHLIKRSMSRLEMSLLRQLYEQCSADKECAEGDALVLRDPKSRSDH